jgi:hypothetical protein
MTVAGTPALLYISAMASASAALTSTTRPSSSAKSEAKAPWGSCLGSARSAERPQSPGRRCGRCGKVGVGGVGWDGGEDGRGGVLERGDGALLGGDVRDRRRGESKGLLSGGVRWRALCSYAHKAVFRVLGWRYSGGLAVPHPEVRPTPETPSWQGLCAASCHDISACERL